METIVLPNRKKLLRLLRKKVTNNNCECCSIRATISVSSHVRRFVFLVTETQKAMPAKLIKAIKQQRTPISRGIFLPLIITNLNILSSKPEEERVLALLRFRREVLVVEVCDPLLHLEAEPLVQGGGGGVAGGDVEDDVLARAGLDQVVEEEAGQAAPPPLRVGEQESDVGLCKGFFAKNLSLPPTRSYNITCVASVR